jgi:glyoxylase-like metal-dependent hydrolase (beta-lactamase superfamily II)
VYAFEEERGLIEGRVAAKGPLPRMMGADPSKGRAVTNPLADGVPVTIGSAQVIGFLVPGHTAGSAAYLSNGVLFFGDAAGGQSDGQLRAAPWLFSDDQAQCKRSLEALGRRLAASGSQVDVLAFAHSGPLKGLSPLTSFH